LALDTPSRAAHLLRFYQSQGFRRVTEFRKTDKPYWSTVLCKTVGAPADHRAASSKTALMPS
jgi:hypothetical protein